MSTRLVGSLYTHNKHFQWSKFLVYLWVLDWLGVYTLTRNICGGVSFQHISKWQIGWEFINSQETFAVESVFSIFMSVRLVGSLHTQKIHLRSNQCSVCLWVLDWLGVYTLKGNICGGVSFQLNLSGRLVGSLYTHKKYLRLS